MQPGCGLGQNFGLKSQLGFGRHGRFGQQSLHSEQQQAVRKALKKNIGTNFVKCLTIVDFIWCVSFFICRLILFRLDLRKNGQKELTLLAQEVLSDYQP